MTPSDCPTTLFMQEYVAQLAAVPSQVLEGEKTKIVIIGCGEWQLIENYKSSSPMLQTKALFSSFLNIILVSYYPEVTGFNGSIYAEPTRALYRALGMTRETLRGTPSDVTPRSYAKGMFGNIMRSLWVRVHPLFVLLFSSGEGDWL